MLYNAKDIKNVLVQVSVNGAITLVLMILSIVFGYITAVNVNEILGAVILIAGLAVTIFVFGNFTLPCYRYYRYLLDIFTGKYTKRSGVISSVGEKPVYKDNKNYYYEVEFNFGSGYNGLFLYDANLGKPEFKAGDKKTLVSSENFIVKVED